MTANVDHQKLWELTADIVSAYVGSQNVKLDEISDVVDHVYEALESAGARCAAGVHRLKPAVDIESSVTEDYIICLEDGKKLKMLKRHLKTAYGMTPDDYRERWGLPASYPMVAPSYAKQRSALAKNIGLGKTGR